jgi:hypothetical protein
MGIWICLRWISMHCLLLHSSCFVHCIHKVHNSISETGSKIITLYGQNKSDINIHLIRGYTLILKGGRDSLVGITTGYGLDDRGVGVRVPVGSRMFSTSSRPALEPTQPPIQWLPGVLSPVVKRPVPEADHSPQTCTEFKKMRIYTFTPSYAFVA